MTVEVLADAEAVARKAASIVAAAARQAVNARGRFVLAVSGGRTPWQMLRALADEDVPWDRMHVVQVDERAAPAGSPDRNLTQLHTSLLDHADRIHPMPVEQPDLHAAARLYAATLAELAGAPALIDLVHLGLGADGHTASLVPGDPVLGVTEEDVAATNAYQGHRRLTLTFPALDRARRILWIVTGADKADALARLRAGDRAIPAGRVSRERALLLCDTGAAGAS